MKTTPNPTSVESRARVSVKSVSSETMATEKSVAPR